MLIAVQTRRGHPGFGIHPRPLPASIITVLISRIQHHPCIWDHDNEFFGKREQIDSAWRAIAEQTDVQGWFDLLIDNCPPYHQERSRVFPIQVRGKYGKR
ncbi:hypothetical protein OESDEN_15817 [Oesophagostomum dentatum]|uniref:MADF domain-containing protein n=1 Tax=Oesophagostomum dentatum TaxID=61180 RepID=A0A0B1SHR7_OESDE|nr:hypothetical protein OESDEN_15817 [Oesophagostomum dentatum]